VEALLDACTSNAYVTYWTAHNRYLKLLLYCSCVVMRAAFGSLSLLVVLDVAMQQQQQLGQRMRTRNAPQQLVIELQKLWYFVVTHEHACVHHTLH
jgi:hypothetical protein